MPRPTSRSQLPARSEAPAVAQETQGALIEPGSAGGTLSAGVSVQIAVQSGPPPRAGFSVQIAVQISHPPHTTVTLRPVIVNQAGLPTCQGPGLGGSGPPR